MFGTDSYYMVSSTAIGMSAPTALGVAPVLKNDVTYVPAELFNILLGQGSVTVSVSKRFNETNIPPSYTTSLRLQR